MKRKIAILWKESGAEGTISVLNGDLLHGVFDGGCGEYDDPRFTVGLHRFARLVLEIEGAFHAGSSSTILRLGSASQPFSFFVRDVKADHPIYIPEYGVIVTEAQDERTYLRIEQQIRSKGLLTHLQRAELEEEIHYGQAIREAKDLHFETWLGIGRDIRIFAMDYNEFSGSNYDWVQPKLHFPDLKPEETNGAAVRYNFRYGRGVGYARKTSRRLEDGVLPIVRGRLKDDEIVYDSTVLVTLENSELKAENVRGTHYLVAGGHSGGNMFTPEQLEDYERLLPGELNLPEETVLFYRVIATNTAPVPRYCFIIAPVPNATGSPTNIKSGINNGYDGARGFGTFTETGRVYAVNTLNGQPMPDEEMAVLLQPGEAATFVFAIPHSPVSAERAERLAAAEFGELHRKCRSFWQDKLSRAGTIAVPEPRIDEMYRAGLLHLDLISYGLEPKGTIAPTIGIYSPIGSESAPIIMHMDSVGLHDQARRSIMYFIDKQHENGFMQNFQEYMLETGCVMWLVGEHYRHTRDADWLREIKSQMRKAYEFTLQWRRRNEREELRGNGYGMLDGKTADPEDPYRSFMLNGYAYIGMQRIAEAYATIDEAFSAEVGREAEAFKRDIRTALFESLARGPAVPLGDGTWCPTVGPWTESSGPVGLFAETGNGYTHGTMFVRDSLLGPLYLIYNEVVDCREPVSEFMLNCHAELMCAGNVAFSQPYYSRHPWIHLKRGEVKPFLQAYYRSFAALADRETYTFGEHLYGQTSPHKTHEEAWFLMETRWMLYMEEGTTLRLLPGIPREWLANGKEIGISRMSSHFGPLSLHVQSDLEVGRIRASIELAPGRLPEKVALRLPHPDSRLPIKVTGGVFDPATGTIEVEARAGVAEVEAYFA